MPVKMMSKAQERKELGLVKRVMADIRLEMLGIEYADIGRNTKYAILRSRGYEFKPRYMCWLQK